MNKKLLITLGSHSKEPKYVKFKRQRSDEFDKYLNHLKNYFSYRKESPHSVCLYHLSEPFSPSFLYRDF